MNLSQEQWSTGPDGEIIYLFTLQNECGTIAKITNYGATITSFIVQKKEGQPNDIVLGFDRYEDYLSPAYLAQYPWFGCAVGRYANRIRHASFELDGKKYQLSKNNGPHQLHGGIRGFDRRIWEVAEQGTSPFPFVAFRLLSREGEEGYPGNLEVFLRFELNNKDELKHVYSATTDSPTPCNLTHHSYFNLNNGKGTIFDHEIRIPASHTLDQDEGLVATGDINEVSSSAYDLRKFTTIGKGLENIPEYDKSFITDSESGELRLVAEARYQPAAIGLQILSTEPIVHFYSGKWTPEVTGKNQTAYGPWSGFCLETHAYPNAVNVPNFPDTILRPGETYHQETIYKVIQL